MMIVASPRVAVKFFVTSGAVRGVVGTGALSGLCCVVSCVDDIRRFVVGGGGMHAVEGLCDCCDLALKVGDLAL